MNVDIKPLGNLSSSVMDKKDVMYEILADPASWAVNGRTSGVLTLDELARSQHDAVSGPLHAPSLSLELMPLRGGSHPLPTVCW
jgi:hypothetical protein